MLHCFTRLKKNYCIVVSPESNNLAFIVVSFLCLECTIFSLFPYDFQNGLWKINIAIFIFKNYILYYQLHLAWARTGPIKYQGPGQKSLSTGLLGCDMYN